jgi:hypothetical protein
MKLRAAQELQLLRRVRLFFSPSIILFFQAKAARPIPLSIRSGCSGALEPTLRRTLSLESLRGTTSRCASLGSYSVAVRAVERVVAAVERVVARVYGRTPSPLVRAPTRSRGASSAAASRPRTHRPRHTARGGRVAAAGGCRSLPPSCAEAPPSVGAKPRLGAASMRTY